MADILTMFIFIMGLTVVLIAFYDCIGLLKTREDISQIARKYTLIAETEGYVSDETREKLVSELTAGGLTEIDLSGTTFAPVGYGNVVTVKIAGKVKEKYDITEQRASTAKY